MFTSGAKLDEKKPGAIFASGVIFASRHLAIFSGEGAPAPIDRIGARAVEEADARALTNARDGLAARRAQRGGASAQRAATAVDVSAG